MLLPASYLNGFAPRDGQPLYPSLWTGCVGAWNPGLGPSGLTLRDNSGFGRHGTLTNGPTFAASQGRYAMNFDGVDDKVLCGNILGSVFQGDYTVVVTIKTSSTGLGRLIGKADYGSNLSPFSVLFNYPTAGKVRFYASTNNDAIALTSAASDLNADQWKTLAFQQQSATQSIYVNGMLNASQTRSNNAATNASQFTIGHDGSGDGLGTQQFSGAIGEVRVYSIAVANSVHQILATRRGIAYEMAPRRRLSVQVTVAPLRYNLFSGSIGNTDVIGAS